MSTDAGSPLSRRTLLRQAGMGLGSVALRMMLAEERTLPARDDAVPPGRGRARNVILLWMSGGPSHLDTFDPKPGLEALRGQRMPESVARYLPPEARLRREPLWDSPFRFSRYGRSGLPVSTLFRETARHADDLCVIRSMSHDTAIHAPAELLALSGSVSGTRPSLGSWLTYGLGSENRNLPGYIVLVSGDNHSGASIYRAGFLPPRVEGTLVEGAGRAGADPDLDARLRSYELSFRRQTAASEAFDLAAESDETKALYGVDVAQSREYGTTCLLARRLVERGVRFTHLVQGGWDAHGDLRGNHAAQAGKVDRPIAGLLEDLKRRGLLDETLVLWGGEFGRTPTAQGDRSRPGRGHSPTGYSVWLAGGGVRGGQVIGATDEIGYRAVERPVHPNDLQATILRLVGLDPGEPGDRHPGRPEIVPGNGGRVVDDVIA